MKVNDLEVIYQDKDIILINKPSGLLTIPDRFNNKLINLYQILKQEFGEIFIVHRLDKDTSGLIIFAKNAESHKDLNTQFEERKVTKIYHAILAGMMKESPIEVDIPLLSNPTGKGGVIPSARGKESLTYFRATEIFRIATFAECKPITGRTHQIRAHAAAMGHPLLVDRLYGGQEEFFLSTLKKKYKLAKGQIERPIIARHTLHNYSLEFNHPTEHKRMYFTAKHPKDFSVTLKQLRKFAELPEYAK